MAKTRMLENQFGFMLGRSTIGAIYILRRLMERDRENRRDLNVVFIDLEKVYDIVPCKITWWALEKKQIPCKYMEVNIYIFTKEDQQM